MKQGTSLQQDLAIVFLISIPCIVGWLVSCWMILPSALISIILFCYFQDKGFFPK